MIQNSNQKKRNNTTHLLKRSHDLEGKSICSLPRQSIAKLPRCHVTLQLDGVPGRGKVPDEKIGGAGERRNGTFTFGSYDEIRDTTVLIKYK